MTLYIGYSKSLLKRFRFTMRRTLTRVPCGITIDLMNWIVHLRFQIWWWLARTGTNKISPTRKKAFNTIQFQNKTIQHLHIFLACMLGTHGIVGKHTTAVLVVYLWCPKRTCTTHCPLGGLLGLQSSFHSYPLHTLYLHFLIHPLLRPMPRTRKTKTCRRAIFLTK